MPKNFLLAMVLVFGALGAPGASMAQQWPDRPVKIVVGYPVGSIGDNVIRRMSEQLGARLGQPVVIENRGGAGGYIAVAGVARARPDGYTLLLGAANDYTAIQFLYKDMGFDPVQEFEPVLALVDVPAVVLINTTSAATTFQEIASYLQSNRGRMGYGSPGIGTAPHLATELINQSADLGLLHVPYRGAPFTVAALLSNEVQMILADAVVGLQHVRSGKLRAVAVGSDTRLAEFPQAPTLKEIGLGQVKANTWWGVAAPKGTPRVALDKLRRAFAGALEDQAVQESLRKLGTVPLSGAATDMGALVREDARYWELAIKKLGVQIN